ncbi:MAG: hypothetical protein JSS78_00845 [Bacteroidetes bacterium]|nr:hypothetical protein [Bacteroidota bacterium]
MRPFRSIIKVDVPRESVSRAAQFAKQVCGTTNYSDANQLALSKIQDDHFISKLGEEAVKIILEPMGKVQGPDYSIYWGKEKSWDDDLYFNGNGIAVKTQRQTMAHRFGLSWTFQCGKKRRDKILDNPNAWVVFVLYDDTHPWQCKVYPPFQIKELIFGKPRLAKLTEHKKVVYAETLPDLLG